MIPSTKHQAPGTKHQARFQAVWKQVQHLANCGTAVWAIIDGPDRRGTMFKIEKLFQDDSLI